MNLNIPKDQVLAMRITNVAFRPWIKKATANALAEAFGCTNYDVVPNVNVDPTVAEIFALTDKEIIDAPGLDKAAVAQVHALKAAANA